MDMNLKKISRYIKWKFTKLTEPYEKAEGVDF